MGKTFSERTYKRILREHAVHTWICCRTLISHVLPLFFVRAIFGKEIAYYLFPTIFKHTSVAHPIALANPINVQIGSFLWRFFLILSSMRLFKLAFYLMEWTKHIKAPVTIFISLCYIPMALWEQCLSISKSPLCGGGGTYVFITITCHPRSIPTQAQEKILYLYSSSLIFSSLAARCVPFQLL